MFIIIDTNLWLTHWALNSPSGSAIRFFINAQKATLVIPEVIRLELQENLEAELLDKKNKIIKYHDVFLTIFGTLKDLVLPTDDQIKEKVESVFSDLGVVTREIPFSLEAARSSFLKTIHSQPPSGENNQQFKDGVIWANCIELLDEGDVYLVTNDKAFFEERDPQKGLANNLKEEAAQCQFKIKALYGLAQLLNDIQDKVSIDEEKLLNTFLEQQEDNIESELGSAGFTVETTSVTKVQIYATETPTRLYVDFEVVLGCEEIFEEGRENATLTISGDGSYDTKTKEYVDLLCQKQRLQFTDAQGQQKGNTVIYVAGTAVVGHSSKVHSVRYSLS